MGAKVTLRSNCMSLGSGVSTKVLSNELWVSIGYPTFRWVEIGWKIGLRQSSPTGAYDTVPRRFWARNRGNSLTSIDYAEFYDITVAYDYYLTVTALVVEDTNDWEVWYGSAGTRHSLSNVFYGPATRLKTGTETISTSAHSFGSSSELKWYDLDRGLHSEWTTSNANAVAIEDEGMRADWADLYERIQTGRGATC
jgi:hypothetical protein